MRPPSIAGAPAADAVSPVSVPGAQVDRARLVVDRHEDGVAGDGGGRDPRAPAQPPPSLAGFGVACGEGRAPLSVRGAIVPVGTREDDAVRDNRRRLEDRVRRRHRQHRRRLGDVRAVRTVAGSSGVAAERRPGSREAVGYRGVSPIPVRTGSVLDGVDRVADGRTARECGYPRADRGENRATGPAWRAHVHPDSPVRQIPFPYRSRTASTASSISGASNHSLSV